KMNKQRYRVIFNLFRSALMVVGETARAAGKEAGGDGDVAAREPAVRSVDAWLRPVVFSLWGALGWVSVQANAQVVADPSAPGNERPTVLNAPNGVPLVNIQTPSAAGVSRNVYSQFDVAQQGAILNNSRSATATQLGGWVQGNPWLAAGSARVILNEVRSSHPSALRGYVEVAGQRAQVVIANPAGIHCDGCGFINANRATLTTGAPIITGGELTGYRVQGGRIAIEGAGMDASGTDYTDLIARAVQINAGLWAKELNVVTGSQTVVHTDEAAPSVGDALSATDAVPGFAIDVAQLGGMYAGKILLVGTEAGVGVRNAGEIGAAVGEVIVTAEGRLENSGRISAQTDAQITSQASVDNSGIVYAGGNTLMTAGQTLANSGSIAAAANTDLRAGAAIESSAGTLLAAGLQPEGGLGASGALRLEAAGHIAAHGQNLSGADQSHQAADVSLAGSQTRARALTLSAQSIDLRDASVVADQSLSATASGGVRTDRAAVLAASLHLRAESLSNQQGLVAVSDAGSTRLHLASLDNRAGQLIASSGAWDISADMIDNEAGQLQAASDLGLQLKGALKNQGGLIRAGATVQIHAESIDNQNTQSQNQGIEAQHLTLSAESIANQSGALRADADAQITATYSLANAQGLISSAGALRINDAIPSFKRLALNNTGGTLIAGSLLNIDAATSSGGGGLLSLGDLSIRFSQDYAQADEIKALGDAQLHSDAGLFNNTDIQAGGVLHISARQLLNDTTGVISAGELRMDIQDTLSNQGLLDGGRAIIRAHTLTNYATGRIYGDELAIGAHILRNESTTRALLSASQGQAQQPAESGMIRNTLYSMFRADWVEPLPANPAAPVGGKVVALKGPGADQVYREVGEAPIIVARQSLSLGAQTIINDIDARLFSGGDLAIGGALDADAQLTGQAAQLNNRSGTIEALGAVDINAAALSNTNEVFITRLEEKSVEPMRQWQLVGGGDFNPRDTLSRFTADEVYTFDCIVICLHAKPIRQEGDQFNRYDFNRHINQTTVVQSKPGKILSGAG
nr:filamentous hemagglutinin N-terminal domain-containing protein [Burkholderiaceae bacterium]